MAAATVAVAMTGGCTAIPAREPTNDPLECINRFVYAGNDKLDRFVLLPLANTYRKGDPAKLPGKLRRRIKNFFDNLHGPIDVSNNLLQGKFKHGFSGIGRLLVNTTIGLGGLFDPASRWGMPRHSENFGQTLATWGVPPGPYIVLPVLGPSSLRDLFGRAFDWHLDPIVQIDDASRRYAWYGFRLVTRRAELVSRDYAREFEYDAYIAWRDAYTTDVYNDAYYDGNAPLDLSIYTRATATAAPEPATKESRCNEE